MGHTPELVPQPALTCQSTRDHVHAVTGRLWEDHGMDVAEGAFPWSLNNVNLLWENLTTGGNTVIYFAFKYSHIWTTAKILCGKILFRKKYILELQNTCLCLCWVLDYQVERNDLIYRVYQDSVCWGWKFINPSLKRNGGKERREERRKGREKRNQPT